MIRDMFDALAPGYDQFNRLSSFGLDMRWRREAIRYIKSGSYILDIGTGTGDLAREFIKAGNRVVGIDFSERMVKKAREKYGQDPHVSYMVASSEAIPFEESTFDGVISAFVIRNLYQGGILQSSLRECYRVLKPGGQMVHVELTRPPKGFLLWSHRVYLRTMLPLFGRIVFGSRWPRKYLSSTIEKLPPPMTICHWMKWAGFEEVRHTPLSGGIASLFVGKKC